ncbi:hypothetical protein TNCV_4114061 [Trichonephila clavipes]|nr:hypothetical protein TNCV_4114061 [Trichonephila clavipes]
MRITVMNRVTTLRTTAHQIRSVTHHSVSTRTIRRLLQHEWNVHKRAVKMGPGKRSKHRADFKIKVIQFAKDNGNSAAARMIDIGESCIREWEKNDNN